MTRRFGAATLALTLALGAVPASAVPAAAAPADRTGPAAPAGRTAGGAPAAQGGSRVSLTLITGDQVVVRGDELLDIRPGPGRERMTFMSYGLGRNRMVVPADALPLLSAGRLDQRLFDVTTLREWGHADAARRDIPLIVTGTAAGGTAGSARTAAPDPGNSAQPSPVQSTTADLVKAGAQRAGPLAGRQLQSVRAPKNRARDVWASLTAELTPGTRRAPGRPAKVWLDGQAELNLDVSVPQIGAPAAWQAGSTGRGTRIAVLDTGIDADHPDFAGRIDEVRNFTGAPDTDDTVGHGTHVASIAAGSGAAAGGRFRGVAPEATLMIGKVCPTRSCPQSAILAGIQWAASSGADVVNLSLGDSDFPGTDPVEQAVGDLTAQYGTLFVVAAGNVGERGSIGSPGTADAALTVGAVDSQDRLAEFSSQGPRLGDGAIKPDVTAPGVRIAAARAGGTDIGTPVDDHYTRVSGTSMATPHASGAAALLAQRHPDWTAAELKAAFMGAATPTPGLDAYAQGAGRLDVARAVTQQVFATTPSLSLGTQRWPHGDDQPLTRVVTYRNHGDSAVTLDLSVAATGPGDAEAPAGMFTVSPAELTVPAGGEAGATLTADTSVPAPDGQFTGAITATSNELAVRTPLAVDREGESYDLTVRHIARDGGPIVVGSYVYGGPGQAFENLSEPERTLRLPPGDYALHGWVVGADPANPYTADFSQPLLRVDRDKTVTLDARTAHPMRITVPDPKAKPLWASFSTHRTGDPFNTLMTGPSHDQLYTAHLGPTAPDDLFAVATTAKFGDPGPNGDFHDSPYVYNVTYGQYGRSFEGFRHDVDEGELAKVDAYYAAERPGRQAEQSSRGMFDGNKQLSFSRGSKFDLPFRRTEYFTAARVVWDRDMWIYQPTLPFETGELELRSVDTYRARRRYTERWNEPVFAPATPILRQWFGDNLTVYSHIHGDSAGHGGLLAAANARARLYRDGELIDDSDYSWGEAGAVVPPDPAEYRLEVESQRTGGFDLSTRQSGTWTFRAGGHHDVPLDTPLLATRFTPSLDASGGAPAGRWFQIPVTVAGVAAGARASRPRVEISFDDGASWKAVDLTRHGSTGWTAKVRHPNGNGFASLRASVTDTAGNTATHTTIHAYRLVPR